MPHTRGRIIIALALASMLVMTAAPAHPASDSRSAEPDVAFIDPGGGSHKDGAHRPSVGGGHRLDGGGATTQGWVHRSIGRERATLQWNRARKAGLMRWVGPRVFLMWRVFRAYR